MVVSIDTTAELAVAATGAGVEIVDITDPTDPELITRIEALAGVETVAIEGPLLAAANGDDSLWLVDLTTPDAPQTLARVEMIEPTDVALYDEQAYVATRNGLQIVDLTEPASPRRAGTVSGRYLGTRVVTDGDAVIFGDGLPWENYLGWQYCSGAIYSAPMQCSPLPSPVDLSRFDAVATDSGIRVSWEVAFESHLLGFYVQRRAPGEAAFRRLHDEPIGAGASYTFLDTDVVVGAEYLYRLKAIDLSGEQQLFGPLRVLFTPGLRFAVSGVRPNPVVAAHARPELMVDMPARASVRLRVYDVTGHLVRVLLDEPLEQGRHRLHWDLHDQRGLAAASGVYYLKLDTNDTSVTRRFVLIR